MLSSQLIQGHLLLFLASVCFSFMSVLVRLVGKEHVVEATFLRFAFGIAVVGLLWLRGWVRIRPVKWLFLCVRGVLGGTAVLCLFLGITHLGLAQGSILFFSYPIFTALCAWLALKERQSPDTWCAMLAAFVGVYLILWPKDWSGALAYKLVALAGAVISGIAITSVRKLRKTDSSYTIFLSLCTFGLLIVAAPAATKSFRFDAWAWLALLGVGALATVGQLMMTFAYKFVQAGQGSIYSFVSPALNVAMGALLFAEVLPLRSWTGACLVLGACMYVSLADREHRVAGAAPS